MFVILEATPSMLFLYFQIDVFQYKLGKIYMQLKFFSKVLFASFLIFP